MAVFDHDGEARHLDHRIVHVGRGGHVRPPRDPRTARHGAREIPFPERPTAVRTGVVDRVEAAVDVEDGDRAAARLDRTPLARGHLGDRRDPHAGLYIAHGLSCAVRENFRTAPLSLAARRRACQEATGYPNRGNGLPVGPVSWIFRPSVRLAVCSSPEDALATPRSGWSDAGVRPHAWNLAAADRPGTVAGPN